jgi:hypothetical protein
MQYSYSWNWNGIDEVPPGVWAAIAGVGIAVLLIALAFLAVFYVFESLGLYTLAKRRGIPTPGWAWVPIGNLWIMGKLADQYDEMVKGKSMKFSQILLWLGVGIAAVSCIVFPFAIFLAFLIPVASIVLLVFYYLALYRIYQSCSPDNAVVFIVLSIIFPVIMPFVLFALRNRDTGLPFIPGNGTAPGGTM